MDVEHHGSPCSAGRDEHAEDGKEAAKAAFGSTLLAWLVHVGADDLTDEVLAQHGFGRNAAAA